MKPIQVPTVPCGSASPSPAKAKVPAALSKSRSNTVVVPLGGNAFLTKTGPSATEVITAEGLTNWTQHDTTCSIYFHLSVPSEFNLALRLQVPPGEGGGGGDPQSIILVRIGDAQLKPITVSGPSDQIVNVGKFSAPTVGYVKVDLSGVSRSGQFFAAVSELLIFGNSGTITFVEDPEDFYFGRRGPSVHLRYDSTTEPEVPLEYFYNEVRVPQGQDVVGAYYAAIGFSEGYFGIQVNSETERRILFSIWSAFDTDDPEAIPEEYRVVLLRKGPEVVVQDFGDEGSGKQSFLRFDWESSVPYKFLVQGLPLDSDNCQFTAWFQDPSRTPTPEWELIASFRKPKRSTWLKNVYSFSENFVPDQGWVERKARFENPWTRSSSADEGGGVWTEVTSATFTGDATSRNGRLDFASGVEGGEFYLRNCGFLSNLVATNQELRRGVKGNVPKVVLEELP